MTAREAWSGAGRVPARGGDDAGLWEVLLGRVRAARDAGAVYAIAITGLPAPTPRQGVLLLRTRGLVEVARVARARRAVTRLAWGPLVVTDEGQLCHHGHREPHERPAWDPPRHWDPPLCRGGSPRVTRMTAPTWRLAVRWSSGGLLLVDTTMRWIDGAGGPRVEGWATRRVRGRDTSVRVERAWIEIPAADVAPAIVAPA